MADSRDYFRKKEKREHGQVTYKDKIRRHRMGAVYRVLLVLLVIGILITLVMVQYHKHIYTSYETVSTMESKSVSGTTDVRLGSNILTYSKDGAHCSDAQGNVLWNQTYEIQDVLIDICRNVAVIADYNGRNVYVVSDEKQLGSFSTDLPIRNVAVSSSGRVVVVTAGTRDTYYDTYSADGEKLFTGSATMAGSGYPMAVSMSPNGEMLLISYIYLNAGVQKTNMAFYNLGPVGDNKTDNLVAAYNVSDVLVPYVKFMDNETAFAVGDNCLMIYKGAQIPTMNTEFNFEGEVQSVFYNEDYIGLVFYSNAGDSLYKMNVYGKQGTQIGTYNFDIDYTEIFFEKNSFTVYNDAECQIMTLDNIEKFKGAFQKSVRRMVPTRSAYKYLIVTNDSFDTIQLK